MKSIKLILFLAIAGMLSFTSCEDYFGDINIDPDNPTKVTPNVLLPQVQVRLAYTLGGDASRFVGIYTQHVDGVARQWAVIQPYGVVPSDMNSMWGTNLYSGVLMDNRRLRDIAVEGKYGHYEGISKAIEAYTIMFVTDMWGDAPYSEAIQGTAETLQPVFDSQQSIYDNIFALIADARTLFNGDNGGFAPSGDDFIFGGDIDQWQRFLNVLEARGRLHLGKTDSGSNYALALAALEKGGFDSGNGARLQFGMGATESGPWYQFIEQRGDVDVGANYVALLQSLNDPRETVFGVQIQSNTSHPFFVRDRNVPIISYTEQEFIRAELMMRAGDAPGAQAAYLEGIKSSFNDVAMAEADYDTYIAQESVVPAAGVTLSEIMTQKYIALFTEPEVFNDWRRTGMPAITNPNLGAVVPRRLPYGQNEILSNENAPSPADVTIFTKVWWDN